MPNNKKFHLEDSFATLGSHWLPYFTSNMADSIANESSELKPKLNFVIWSKNNEIYKERDTANNVNILQGDLEQKVGKITYISINLGVPFSLLAYLQGGEGGGEKKLNLLNYYI